MASKRRCRDDELLANCPPDNVLIPGEGAHDSGMMPPTHSEMISPTVPR